MLPHLDSPWSTFLFIICAITSRIQHGNILPSNDFIMNYGICDDTEHWTSPITWTDDLCLSSAPCYIYGALSLTSNSPNQTQIIHQLHRGKHVKLALLLILAGDVASNPGPRATRKPKYPCVHCSRGVISSSRAISCDSCERWVHSRCTKILTDAEYDKIVADDAELTYLCNSCSLDQLPFAGLGDVGEDMGTSNFTHSAQSTQSDFSYDCFKQKGIHFIHINIRSLTSKLSELRTFAQNTSASVIGISETWLDSSFTDSEIKIEGYTVLRADRNREGGGVCLYIKNNLAFNCRPDLNDENVEALWIELLLPRTKPIIIGVCYRPPKDNDFLDRFEKIISLIRSDCEVMVLGDFNINILANKSYSLLKKYLDMLNMFYLKHLISEPTRISSTCSSAIDHIFCNNTNKISQSGTINIGLSDHLLIYCTRKVVKGQVKHHNTVRIRSLKRYTVDALLSAISSADWSNVYCSDVDSAWTVFRTTFCTIIDYLAPVKEVRLKARTEPWMCNEILDAIKERDNLLYRFRKHQEPSVYKEYCKSRNKIQRDIKKAKSDYFSDKIEEHKSNPKKLWQQLKTLGYSSKDQSQSRIVLDIDGELCYNSNTVANYINYFYTTIADTLVSKLPTSLGNFAVESENFLNFYKELGVTPDAFQLSPVSSDFIYKELCSLNINKSTGLDGIPARFLKDGAVLLKDQLTHIVNVSITTNVVPKEFKSARVRPLFKKSSRSDVGNYRPVSILCVTSKLLEKAVYIQLESYLKEKNILYDFQSGFRGAFSTDTCLIHLTDYIRNQMSVGNYTGLVLLDLQKAFDTVDHVILCKKLRAMGVTSVDWFMSYLSCRTQIVNVNHVDSDPLNVPCGVPQGSILGPLLFLCYVNDMASSVDCKLLLYADDSALLVSGRDPNYIAHKLGKELESCSQWLVDNKLSLHLGKTECILFGTKKKLKKVKSFTVSCSGEAIKSTKSAKYLGVTLDESLSGESIAWEVIKMAGSRLRFLYRHAGSLNRRTRKTLCSALILCHYDYASSAWFSSIPQLLKNRLQTMQNKVVRFVLNLDSRSHVGQEQRKQLGLLSVEDRMTQLKLNQVFKIYHGLSPDYLSFNFTRISSIHHHSTKGSPHNFFVPRVQGQANNTFFYSGIQHWNSLLNSVKQVNKFPKFKEAAKKYLAEQALLAEQDPFVAS